MNNEFEQYRFFKGEKKCPYKSLEESYLWCLEKECYKYKLTKEEQAERIKNCISSFRTREGHAIAFPY